METKCAKMPPTGSNLTEALKHGKIPCQNLHTRPNLLKRKIQSRIRSLGIQLINITIWYRISHFRGDGLQDLDDFVGNDPTQTSEVKSPHAAFSH